MQRHWDTVKGRVCWSSKTCLSSAIKNSWVKSQLLHSAQLVDMVLDTKRTFVHSSLIWIWLSKERGAGRGSVQKELKCLQLTTRASSLLSFNSAFLQPCEREDADTQKKELATLLASSRAQTLISRALLSWAPAALAPQSQGPPMMHQLCDLVSVWF